MRLIDADAIVYDEREEGVLSVTEYDIDSMPTIEAIPVDWISKRIGELIAHGHVSQASCLAAEIISLWREEQC